MFTLMTQEYATTAQEFRTIESVAFAHAMGENGVFLTLLAMQWQSVDGELFYMPTKVGFKEWQAMGGSLSSDAKVRYSYGNLSCHKNQVEG